MKTFILSVVSIALIQIFGGLSAAQQSKADQIGKAAERAENAANILSKVIAPSLNVIPEELAKNAKAVAVFPRVTDANLLIQQITSGFGVISIRLPGNWTYPAYYSFRGIGYDLNTGGVKSSDIILLFMSDDALNLLKRKNAELKGDAKVIVGPIGTITSEQRAVIADANVIGYVVSGGQLVGKGIKSNFLKGFKISADDRLNKAVYGLSGQEVLSGSRVNDGVLPREIASFPETLRRHLIP